MIFIGFSEVDTRFMDDLRYYRNGIKYYGTILSILVFLASVIAIIDIWRMIKKTYNIKTEEEFWKYFAKAGIVLLLSLISVDI